MTVTYESQSANITRDPEELRHLNTDDEGTFEIS